MHARRRALLHCQFEQALWLAVIQQMVMDAMTGINRPMQQRDKQDAITQLTTDNDDMRILCDYAGLDWQSLQRFCRRFFCSSSVLAEPLPSLELAIDENGQLFVAEW